MKLNLKPLTALASFYLAFSLTVNAQTPTWTAVGTGTLNVNPIATKVGIGTLSPFAPLNVVGPNATPTTSTFAGGALSVGGLGTNISLQFGVSTSPLAGWLQSRNQTTSNLYDLKINPLGGNIILGVANGVGGNVGIGTGSPTCKLQVNSTVVSDNSFIVSYNGVQNFKVKSDGFVYARDLTVMAGTFPDYVFDNNYKLLSLPALKAFIKYNHHLPKMPTAQEVETNGMSVSQTNVLLVEKVEELTLYIIKLQEEFDALKRQVNKK